MEGVWSKFRALRYFLQPTSADWESLRIPDSLFPVYYLARPARLIWSGVRAPSP